MSPPIWPKPQKNFKKRKEYTLGMMWYWIVGWRFAKPQNKHVEPSGVVANVHYLQVRQIVLQSNYWEEKFI